MSIFDFSKKETATDTETKKSGIWASQLASAVSEARSRGLGSKKRTQEKSDSTTEESGRGSISEQTKEQIRKMFDPDAWRAIVRAPFALGKAMTGRECWDLEKRQEDTLATSTSATAEYFLQTDPKWVALTLFAFNWSVILTEKFALNAKMRAEEEKLNPKKPDLISPVQVVK